MSLQQRAAVPSSAWLAQQQQQQQQQPKQQAAAAPAVLSFVAAHGTPSFSLQPQRSYRHFVSVQNQRLLPQHLGQRQQRQLLQQLQELQRSSPSAATRLMYQIRLQTPEGRRLLEQ